MLTLIPELGKCNDYNEEICMVLQRTSGILLHITSLPGPFGIGDIGPEAMRFIDWLVQAGQSLWQVLPLGPTGYGDSPYAPFSSFAGNELLLSPEWLCRDGLLTEAELDKARLPVSDTVDYARVIPLKRQLAHKAAQRVLDSSSLHNDFETFKQDQAAWLSDYSLFIDIKREYDQKAVREGVLDSSWNNYWPKALARKEQEALSMRRDSRRDSIALVEAEQFLFRRQWDELRSHAAHSGVSILGDLPIYVAMDSADAWASPELFRLDSHGQPTEVAGVPPDYFSVNGQLWGNPLYEWEYHKQTGFAWWIARVEASLSLYDMVRIDHFRGLVASWSVPAAEETARNGAWKPSPGTALLTAFVDNLGGELPIIAEDLGFIDEDVATLRARFNLPGMRILQFAFDARESGNGLDPDNPFLPHNYVQQCVVYTGTHDNDTLAGWLQTASDEEKVYVEAYLGYSPSDTVAALIREALKSSAALAVVPMQDVLGLGSEARMNTPSTIGGNWSWRLSHVPEPGRAQGLHAMATLYGRAHGGARRTCKTLSSDTSEARSKRRLLSS